LPSFVLIDSDAIDSDALQHHFVGVFFEQKMYAICHYL